MLSIRKATETDFDTILAIYRYAQDYMIKSGNPNQWGHTYPKPELIQKDIREGLCMVICDEREVHGVFALCEGPEPTYMYIENGEWMNDDPYATIHRIAGDGKVHGVFRCVADYCKKHYSSIRIDTHADNTTMQRQIEKNGFKKCGIIYVRDRSPRIAYQWVM